MNDTTTADPDRSATARPDLLRVLGAVMVLLGGAVHLQQYWRVFHSIDIGPLFLVNGVASLLVGIALLTWDGLAPALAGLALSMGSLVALLASRTTGLLGFDATGYDTAEYEAIVFEFAAVVLLSVVVVRAWRARPATTG